MRLYGIARPLILWTAERAEWGDVVVTGCTCHSWVGLKSDSSMTLHPASRDSVHHCTSLSDPNKRQLRGHVGVTAVKEPEAPHLFYTDLLFCCIWLS